MRPSFTPFARCRLLVAIAAVLLVSGLLVSRAEAASLATNVAIGDSITNQSSDEILSRFYMAGWPGAVYGVDSQRIDQMRPYIQVVAQGTPSLQRMFIFLGTNDAWQYQGGKQSLSTSVLQLHAAVHDVIDVRPKSCVFLVTIHDFWYVGGGIDTTRFHNAAMRLNSEMKKIDSAFSRVFVIDWNALSTGQNWFVDAVGHLNQTGQDHLADYYRWFGTTSDTPSRPCGPV